MDDPGFPKRAGPLVLELFSAITDQVIGARRHMAARRGGDWLRVTWAEEVFPGGKRDLSDEELMDLDRVLRELAEIDPRQARVVELRFFGGLTVDEAAEALGVSKRTADGDWAKAKEWLRRRLLESKDPL